MQQTQLETWGQQRFSQEPSWASVLRALQRPHGIEW